MMSIKTIEWYVGLVDGKISFHGLYSYGGKWVRLRNNLRRERARAVGREDCVENKGCRSANGCYLEGYHDPKNDNPYYVTWGQLAELRG